MEDIIIKKNEDVHSGWFVEQGDKVSCECGWDEMMGLVSALTMPNDRGCLRWMRPKVEKYIPEDGEFVVSGWECNGNKCEWVAIVKDYATEDFYDTYYGRYITNQSSDKRTSWFNESCDSQSYTRPATEEEIKFALDGLHHDGSDWDFEKEKIVEWKWRPSDGEDYYYCDYILGSFKVRCATYTDTGYIPNPMDVSIPYKAKEECQAMCDKLNEAIKNVK